MLARTGFETRISAIALTLMVVSCSFANKTLPRHTDSGVELYAFHGHRIQLVHLTPREDLTEETQVVRGELLGTVQRPPARLSERFHEDIQAAEELYSKQKVEDARVIMEKVQQHEPDNVFVLELFARILFRLDLREQSFQTYRRLMQIVEKQHASPDAGIIIDVWFTDAYWKLGILFLDRKEYALAAMEISKALASRAWRNSATYDQALSYLVEAFYFMRNYDVCKYYAAETLKRNPKNTYVFQFKECIGLPA
jgi:tetratricopeptide (TPR) repeat protein